MKDAFYAIGGGGAMLWALYSFLLWMATGKLWFRPSAIYKKVCWQDEPVQFAVVALVQIFLFVGGCWLLVSTLLKWLSFDSRYS